MQTTIPLIELNNIEKVFLTYGLERPHCLSLGSKSTMRITCPARVRNRGLEK